MIVSLCAFLEVGMHKQNKQFIRYALGLGAHHPSAAKKLMHARTNIATTPSIILTGSKGSKITIFTASLSTTKYCQPLIWKILVDIIKTSPLVNFMLVLVEILLIELQTRTVMFTSRSRTTEL